MADQPATRSIVLEIEIDAPLDAARQALTSPEELARWFPPISGGSGEAGGKLLISWGKSMEWWTTVAVADANHIRWVDDSALATDWRLETRGGTTVVRIVNSGFDASSNWDDQFNATEAGWRYFLFNLRHYLERHAGTPRVMVWARRKSPVTRDALWSRLVGASGFHLTESSIVLGDVTHTASVALSNAPTHLWVRIPSLNDALLFVESEPGSSDGFHCGIWLSTYGLPEGEVAALRAGMRDLADRVFA